VKKLEKAGGYTVDISRISTNSDTLVFASKQNKYLISLEHSVGYGEAGERITVKFLDSDGKFEDSFLSEPFIQHTLRQSIERFSEGNFSISQFNDYINADINAGIKVYIIYGIGNDSRNWSSPILCTLTKSSIETVVGVRNYIYTFNPDSNFFFKAPVAGDAREPNFNHNLNFGAQNMRMSVELPVSIHAKGLANISNNIRNLIKLYFSKVTGKGPSNVIVVLPKFTEECIDFSNSKRWLEGGLETSLKEEWSKTSQFGLADLLKPVGVGFLIEASEFEKAKINALGLKSVKNMSRFYKSIFNIDLSEVTNEATAVKLKEKLQGQINLVDLQTETLAKSVVNSQKILWRLIMSTDTKSVNQSTDETKPQIPNLWIPLNNIESGIKAVTDLPITITAYQESDSRMLSLFKRFGIISSDTEPCVIVGDVQMIRDYLYCNQSTAFGILGYKSKYEFDWDDPLRKVLQINGKDYRMSLINTAFRKKGNSSFEETLVTDEFSLKNKISNDLTKETSEIAARTDIPTFTHNLKNPNVISFTIENTATYMEAIRTAVVDNRANNLIGALLENKEKLLATVGLTDEEAKFVIDQVEGAYKKVSQTIEAKNKTAGETLFQTVTKDGYDFFDKLESFDKPVSYIPGSIELRLESYNVANRGQMDSVIAINNAAKKLKNDEAVALATYLQVLQSNASGTVRENDNFGYTPKEYQHIYYKVTKDNVSYSYDNTSYLALAYQAPLKKIKPNLKPGDLKNAADLLVLINQYELAKSKNSRGLELYPGVNGPTQAAIHSKIMDYMARQAFKVSIKTLPFFHLSNLFTIGRPAYFYSKKMSIMNTDITDEMDFFSGLYKISSFKHMISTDQVFSEFTLFRDPVNINDIPPAEATPDNPKGEAREMTLDEEDAFYRYSQMRDMTQGEIDAADRYAEEVEARVDAGGEGPYPVRGGGGPVRRSD
jgi:hypothetical protein